MLSTNLKSCMPTLHFLLFSYYKVNEVRQFTNSRPFHKGKKNDDNEFKVPQYFLFIIASSWLCSHTSKASYHICPLLIVIFLREKKGLIHDMFSNLVPRVFLCHTLINKLNEHPATLRSNAPRKLVH